MFKGIFAPKPRRAQAPEGVVIYAIGDIHGRADLLERLIAAIKRDNDHTAARGVIVGLGDYIDRGGDSRAVIDQLIALQQSPDFDCRFLCGNHEEVLLDFLRSPKVGARWRQFGGRECLSSYGVLLLAEVDEGGWTTVRDEFAAALPAAHLEFLRSLESSLSLGEYFFSHAGARPGVALKDQVNGDLLWIREPFLSHKGAFEQVVVHGHSVKPDVHLDARRIGIDTGAYATGVLTALRLEGSTLGLFQTDRSREGATFSTVAAR